MRKDDDGSSFLILALAHGIQKIHKHASDVVDVRCRLAKERLRVISERQYTRCKAYVLQL